VGQPVGRRIERVADFDDDLAREGVSVVGDDSTVLPPATANVPMVRAMFPVPMMLMLLMSCPVLTDDRRG
jgi:hypothetical protein